MTGQNCIYAAEHPACIDGVRCVCGYHASKVLASDFNQHGWKSKFKVGEIVEIKGVKFSVAHINKRGLSLRRTVAK